MISLFLDTCNFNTIIGIFEDNNLVFSKIIKNNNDLSERLVPLIKLGMDETNHSIKDLKKIYVAIGPGSFTGIRIGVTVAKVIAWSLNIEIVPISSLEVMASINTNKKYICPLIDARRGFVYTALYDNNLYNIIEDKYVDLNSFINNLNDKNDILFVSYENVLEYSIIPEINIEKVFLKHLNDKSVNPHQINPIYLKLTEAEEKLNDKRNNN